MTPIATSATAHVRVVELSIQEGAELEMSAGHVAHGLAAVVALNNDRFFGQPPDACGDGAQSVKVPQLQITGVHGLALLDHGHVSAGHEVRELREEQATRSPATRPKVPARLQLDHAAGGEMNSLGLQARAPGVVFRTSRLHSEGRSLWPGASRVKGESSRDRRGGPPPLRRQARAELLGREGRLAGEEAIVLELDECLANVERVHAQLPGDLLVEARHPVAQVHALAQGADDLGLQRSHEGGRS